jgi:hypothetical protein
MPMNSGMSALGRYLVETVSPTRTGCTRLLALILTANYIAFHVEPFEEEYERNHPAPSATPTFIPSPESWESFDKTNVPVAYTYLPFFPEILYCRFVPIRIHVRRAHIPFLIIRDKSPPAETSA